MENIKVKIFYWTEGKNDFDDIQQFRNNISNDFNTEITSEPGGLGGGLYDLAIEIIADYNFTDIAKNYLESYIQDGVKIGIAYFWKPIFKKIKDLFKTNKQYQPDIEVVKFIFNDIEIIIYSLYNNSIAEVINEIIPYLSTHYTEIIRKNISVESIHIPIFNHIDTYKICLYRVKLDVDENISSFKKKDYFKLWGIKSKNGIDYVYNTKNKNILETKFYTQVEYNSLFKKKFDARQI